MRHRSMTPLQLLALLALVLQSSGSYSGIVDGAGPAYATARIPAGSTATFVQVEIAGVPVAECQAGEGAALCASTRVILTPGDAPIVIESDGAWEVRVFVEPARRLYLPEVLR